MENPFLLVSEKLDRLEILVEKLITLSKVEVASPDDERLTRKEIKSLYKVSYPTIHKYMQMGLPYEKAGRKTLFLRKEVDKFFRSGLANQRRG